MIMIILMNRDEILNRVVYMGVRVDYWRGDLIIMTYLIIIH